MLLTSGSEMVGGKGRRLGRVTQNHGLSIICPSVKRLPSMECVRSCDQQPLKQKKVFALKRSLIPRGFTYSSNVADSILFTPPTWRT